MYNVHLGYKGWVQFKTFEAIVKVLNSRFLDYGLGINKTLKNPASYYFNFQFFLFIISWLLLRICIVKEKHVKFRTQKVCI
jgi:hypothetical protein